MAKLGSNKRPIVVRLQSEERVEEIAKQCESRDLRFIIGIEPDKPEDLSDLEKVLNGTTGGKMPKTEKIGRNDPCSCGSGKKYKKCCGAS